MISGKKIRGDLLWSGVKNAPPKKEEEIRNMAANLDEKV